jgi:hypothetical protein
MMDFLFFVKTFALTIAIVMVMQIPVGEQSLETHALGWVQHSSVVNPVRAVAHGAAKVVHDLGHKITDAIHDNVSKNKKEDSRLKHDSSFHWLHSFKDKKSDD